MDSLFALQKLQLQAATNHRKRPGSLEAIRKSIPAGVLKHYDRLVAHGKKAVAIVRNGVCTECHIRVAIGTLAGLAHDGEAHRCDNCGRYLYLPDDEPIMPEETPTRHAGRALLHAHAA